MERGKVLVTGASSGIGCACAVRLSGLGYQVLAGVRDPMAGEALCALAGGIEPVLLDVTDSASIRAAVDKAGGDGLAGLVNNAGVSVIGPLELVPVETWRRQFEVNVFGLVAVTQAFLPLLRRVRGRIVNIGSIAGRSALPGTGTYDASKFAVEGVTDALRMEVRPFGIHVSLIEPGAVDSAIWKKSLDSIADLQRNSPAEVRELYQGLMASVRAETAKAAAKALPADRVAKVVEHALTARRPKTRYVIGGDARFWLLLNLLPDAWRDRLILSEISK